MSRLDSWAKRLAPRLSKLALYRPVQNLGTYIEILQGRGSGTGWDMVGETTAAASFLSGVPSPVIFDGGANFGQWAMEMFTRLAHADPRFFLFEPQLACQEVLSKLPMKKTVVRIALGDQSGEAVISGAAPGHGAASLFERHDTYFEDMTAHQERVSVTTLDNFVSRNRIDRVDLLKLDIEGSEIGALRGGEASLRDGIIRVIAFEFGSANIYSRSFFRDFWELLSPHGYRFFRIAPGGRLIRIPEYSENLEHFRGVSNYIAARS